MKQALKIMMLLLLALAFSAPGFRALAVSEESAPPEAQPVTAQAPTDAVPVIVFEEVEHDFGNIKPQEAVKHTFKFKNTGNAVLIIENVRATCGCTGTLLSGKEIAPGGEGTIEVTYRATPSGGKTQKSIHVQSNDPNKPDLQLTIKAFIVVPVEIKPRSLFWAVDKSKSSTRLLKLVHQPEIKLSITDIKISSPAFTASVAPETVDEGLPTYNIEVACDGNLPRGSFNEKLEIYTDNPDYQIINVTLRGNVAGAVRIIPNEASLGVIKNGVIPARILRVYALDRSDFAITALEATSPLIKADFAKESNSNRYAVNITLTEVPPLGAFSGKLIIKTNVPEEESFEIPVYAYVR